MTLPRWDAAASRVVRYAESMFASTDLGWFEPSAVRLADPRSAFDQLIRTALTSREPEPRPAAEPVAAAPLPLSLPRASWPRTPEALAEAAFRPGPTELRTRTVRQPAGSSASTTIPAPPRPRGTPPTHHPAREHSAPPLTTIAVRPRRLASSAPLTDDVARLSERLAEAGVVPMLDPASLASASDARILDAPSSRLASPVAHAPERARPLTPAHPIPAPGLPASDVPAAEGPSRGPQPAMPPIRLVEGVSALQGLMQAVVAESRGRHAATAVEQAVAPATPGPVPFASSPATHVQSGATSPGAWPIRALTLLDDVAEDMLVDRLCDRLQERLRDQALRQFGLTGGLI